MNPELSRRMAVAVNKVNPSMEIRLRLHASVSVAPNFDALDEFAKKFLNDAESKSVSADLAKAISERFIAKYDPDQPRDEGGRWTSELGMQLSAALAQMKNSSMPVVLGKDYSQRALDVAQSMMAKVSLVEPKITEDMKRIAASLNAKMVGLDFRLKTTESLAVKLEKDAAIKGSFENAEAGIRDAVRYTMVADDQSYTDMVKGAVDQLTASGYSIDQMKNFYDATTSAGYKAVHLQMTSPDGQPMELQFHTPESFTVKEDVSHPLYKLVDSLVRNDPSSPLIPYASQKAAQAWASVKTPTGAQFIGKMDVSAVIRKGVMKW